jgi:hypothetical protein
MPTRKPKAAPTSARVHRGLAAGLVFVVLGGCAQVLGLEEWEPVDCEEDADDPAECEEPVSCSECLFGMQATCQGDRMACNAELTGCSTILSCSQMCSGNADPVECIRGCCPMGNGPFDTYLTCMCGVCADACGSLTLGCENACNLPL